MRKITRFAAISLALSAFFALTACGGKQAAVLDERPLDISYTDIQLGSTGTDIATTITLLSHRTDMLATDYPGKGWSAYLAEFNKLYPDIRVGITLSMHDCQALPGGESQAEAAWDEEFRHYLPYIRDDDFLGVQNYTRTQYGPQGQLPSPEGARLTQMDYEFYPEALEHVLRKVHDDFKGDLIVTENGVAVSDDESRVEFIERALAGVERCVKDHIPVKGYFYWSLLDNFEWQKGFSMTFGLIAVDRETQTRTPKESLRVLGLHSIKAN